MTTNKLKRISALLVACASTVGLGVAVVAVADNPSTEETHLPVQAAPADPPHQVAAQVPDEARSAFGVFRRGTTSDLAGHFSSTPGIVGRAGANLAQARPAAKTHGATVWVIPGDDQICLTVVATDPIASGCDTIANAKTGTLAGTTSLPSGETLLYGLVTDDVASADALLPSGKQALALSSNVYAAVIPHGMTGVRLVDADGSTRTIGVTNP